jgi:predicted transcriptional regulator
MARYKNWEFYCCLALNRLVSELNIDLYQPDLETKLDAILSRKECSVSKLEISKEIKSNHLMTEKVLAHLASEELIVVEQEDRAYSISITRKGVLFARRYNEFYITQYRFLIEDHYRYRPLPIWFTGAKR